MKKPIILFISIFFSIFITSCVSEEEPEVVSVAVGDRCPEFSVVMNDGKTISTSDLEGKKSVIVFFNTGCGDCRKELPEIQELYNYILSNNLDINILCISRAQKEEEVSRYWSENNLTLPYSAQNDKSVYNLFASSVIPRIYIISPSLMILQEWDDNPIPSMQEILAELK
ncbi:MAG: TlpA family protein disulfide reductase [Muribaculaceae bacterium]|nr:TlpA family protein disulfide reductase [Muribaculaceae bacterium]